MGFKLASYIFLDVVSGTGVYGRKGNSVVRNGKSHSFPVHKQRLSS